MLAQAAQRMRQLACEADVLARMGGDEFAILQSPVGDTEAALGLARRLLAGLAEPIEIERGLRVEIGASIGIALYMLAGADRDTLLQNADAAMCRAKASGRNCAQLSEPGASRAIGRVE